MTTLQLWRKKAMGQSFRCELTLATPRRWVREIPIVKSGDGAKVAFKLLIVFLLILYSQIAFAYKELDALRPALVIALSAIFMLVVELSQARQNFRFMWPQGALLIAFLAVCFVSSFSAFWPRFAFEKTTDFAKIVLIWIVIENTVTNAARLRTVLMTMVIGGLFPAVGTIHHYVYHILREGRATWIGVFANANEDAYGLVILIPIAAALAIESKWWVRVVLVCIIASYLLAIFLTYSRGGLLGVLAVVGLAGWKQKSAIVRAVMVVGLVGLIVLAGAYWQRSQGFNDLSNDSTVTERIGTMRAGIRMFEANPLFGIGPACSMFAYPIYAPDEARCGCQLQLTVHNTFVQVLSEVGILGFMPFMLLFGVSFWRAWKLQKGALSTYATALEVALWGFVVCGLSGGFAYTWWPYLLGVLIVAATHMSTFDPQERFDAAN